MRAVPKAPRPPRSAPALSGLAAFALAVSAAASARADPCKAIPDRGPTPAALAPGRVFAGPVVYVGDGDSLCVALGSGPANWAEVRLADVYAPELAEPQGREAKAILERIVLGRRLDCVAGRRSYDRIVAACRMGGRAVSAHLQAAGAPVGGRGRPNR
jgi:micrococcal nuclease